MTIELMEKVLATLDSNSHLYEEIANEITIEHMVEDAEATGGVEENVVNALVDYLREKGGFVSGMTIKHFFEKNPAINNERFYFSYGQLSHIADGVDEIVKRKIHGRYYYCYNPMYRDRG